MAFDHERLTRRGIITELEQKKNRLELLIQGDIAMVRGILAPYVPIEEINAQQALVMVVELAGRHAEYLGVLADIANNKKALGIG